MPELIATDEENALIPRKPKGFDYRDDPVDMDPEFLISLSYQLYARANRPDCTESLHNRAMELKAEIARRILSKISLPARLEEGILWEAPAGFNRGIVNAFTEHLYQVPTLRMYKYVLCPGEVVSATDGDIHYISAKQLQELYGVNPKDCIFYPDMSDPRNKHWIVPDDAIFLHPREDGNYTL